MSVTPSKYAITSLPDELYICGSKPANSGLYLRTPRPSTRLHHQNRTTTLHNNEANPSIYTKCFAFLPPIPTDNKIFLFHLREVHTHSDGDQQQGHGDRVQAALLVSHGGNLLGLGVLGCVGVNLQRETAFFSVSTGCTQSVV
jgi:hypothetical protein